jgi:hypothetical protein
MKNKKSPAGAGTPAGSENNVADVTTITAAALILQHRAGSANRKILGLQVNPKQGRRPWLVTINDHPAFAVTHLQLLNNESFWNAAFRALFVHIPDLGDMYQYEPLVWRHGVEGLMTALVRGGGA